jgi:hypothetical protein
MKVSLHGLALFSGLFFITTCYYLEEYFEKEKKLLV